MKINTGKGSISLMTVIAIWSLSLVVNLPGLAITPVLAHLNRIFPHTSQLEIQLLTVLPNLMIIPFVLLSGKLSLSKSKITIVVVSLAIYLAGGILYLFASSMVELIVISCLLGVGCGLLIPLAAGLLADTFTGKYRMKQLGIKSGVSNMALVAATFAVGWLSKGNWHLPFLVYLLPAIPLLLSVFLHGIPRSDLYPDSIGSDKSSPSLQSSSSSDATVTAKAASKAAMADVPAHAVRTQAPGINETGYKGKVKDGFILSRIWSLIGVYFLTCYATVVVSYYSPFLMQNLGMSDTDVSIVTALFFLAVFLPGFGLPLVVKALRQSTLLISSIVMVLGLLLFVITPHFGTMCVAAMLVGFGYGVFQPLIYDKATRTITMPGRSTLALAFVLAANYLSVSVTPFIVDFFSELFGMDGSDTFPFYFNAIVLAAFTVAVAIFRRKFVFSINQSYY